MQYEVSNPGDKYIPSPLFGINNIITSITDRFVTPLFNSVYLRSFDIEPEVGLIISGYSGTGKTSVALSIPSWLGNVPYIRVRSPNKSLKVNKMIDTLTKLTNNFKSVGIIILDDIDAMTESVNDSIIGLFDKIHENKLAIGVIATVGSFSSVNKKLIRSGRFGIRVIIPFPNRDTREEIITQKLNSLNITLPHNIPSQTELANRTAGYTPVDIVSLLDNAMIQSLISGHKSITPDALETAFDTIKPEILQDGFVKTNISWDDVGGMEHIRQEIMRRIVYPRQNKAKYKAMGFSTYPKGNIILHGPPGVGKTFIIKALSNQIGFNLLYTSGSDIFHKYVGQSEKSVRNIFQKAAMVGQSIIFIDEADSVLKDREDDGSSHGARASVVNTFLELIDGFRTEDEVIVIAATNRLDMIDPAFLRYGRFTPVEVGFPDANTRREIIAKKLVNVPSSVDVDWLVEATEGYASSNIVGIIESGMLRAIDRSVDEDTSPMLMDKDIQYFMDEES